MKWKRPRWRPATVGRRSGRGRARSPLRCSDCPGGATHFGSGWRANSTACSASVRNPLRDRSATPSARAAAAMRSNAARRPGASACPAGTRAARHSRRRSRTPPVRCRPAARAPPPPGPHATCVRRARRRRSTATRIRTGANVSAVGERDRGPGRAVRARHPLGRSPAEREVRVLLQMARIRRPSISGGSNSRGYDSRIARAPPSAARSAARWAASRVPNPRANAPSTSPPRATAISPPTSSTATCPPDAVDYPLRRVRTTNKPRNRGANAAGRGQRAPPSAGGRRQRRQTSRSVAGSHAIASSRSAGSISAGSTATQRSSPAAAARSGRARAGDRQHERGGGYRRAAPELAGRDCRIGSSASHASRPQAVAGRSWAASRTASRFAPGVAAPAGEPAWPSAPGAAAPAAPDAEQRRGGASTSTQLTGTGGGDGMTTAGAPRTAAWLGAARGADERGGVLGRVACFDRSGRLCRLGRLAGLGRFAGLQERTRPHARRGRSSRWLGGRSPGARKDR